jgi:polyisoprenoid-binding protein YceI
MLKILATPPKTYRAFLLFACSGATFGQTMRVQLDNAATTVNFTLGDVLHTVHGDFKLKTGDLWFDLSSGKAGGQIVVNALSGESGSSARDSRMHKNILESAKYADITFRPDHVEGKINPQGDSDVRLHGQFTIHGGTHEVTMAVTSHITDQRITAAIAFKVPYVQWGMKNPSTLLLRVNDTVEINIQASGRLSPMPALP